jgi:hypothetical protein
MGGSVEQNLEHLKQATDAAIGVTAVVSPLWMTYLENGLGLFMLIGGALLLGLRLWLTIREIRERKDGD